MRNGNGRRASDKCSCRHADLGRMREILNHVFLCREIPKFVSRQEKNLILGKLVYRFQHGNGFNCPTYCLTGRGKELLIGLYEKRCK
jgi:hypothetical protein